MPAVDGNKIVPGMAVIIKKRMRQLGFHTVQGLVDATSLSRPSIDHLVKGHRRRYPDSTTVPFCEAMQWESDCVEALLRGDAPTPLATLPPEGELWAQAVERLNDRLDRQDEEIAKLRRQLARLAGRSGG